MFLYRAQKDSRLFVLQPGDLLSVAFPVSLILLQPRAKLIDLRVEGVEVLPCNARQKPITICLVADIALNFSSHIDNFLFNFDAFSIDFSLKLDDALFVLACPVLLYRLDLLLVIRSTHLIDKLGK